jgi:hypothetical protein
MEIAFILRLHDGGCVAVTLYEDCMVKAESWRPDNGGLHDGSRMMDATRCCMHNRGRMMEALSCS